MDFISGFRGGARGPGPPGAQIWGPRLYSEAQITHFSGGPELGPTPGKILDPLLDLDASRKENVTDNSVIVINDWKKIVKRYNTCDIFGM